MSGQSSSGVARRDFLKMTGGLAVGLALSRVTFAADPARPPPKPENVIGADAALDRLLRGNARYVEGVALRHDFKAEREALAGGQNPFAAILSCADSRIAPEYAFDAARGDLFVVRVAGNFANADMIASLEYGVAVLNVPLIMVLGHGSCGAVDATVKAIKEGTQFPGHLPSLISAITPAVKAVLGAPGDVLDNAIKENVVLNAHALSTSTPILAKAVEEKTLRIVGAVYNLATGRVELV